MSKKSTYFSYALIFLASLIFFEVRFGMNTLNIYDDSWFLSEQCDFMNVYLQFLYFTKFGDFPFPGIWGYSYPSMMAPIYTNIMWPVAKLFSFFAPSNGGIVQYFGWWFFVCTILQGLGARYVFKSLGLNDLLPLVLFSIIVLLTPALLDRSAHVSFYPHFLILFSIGLYYDSISNFKKYLLYGLLVVFATSIQPYMALMVYAILFGSLCKDVSTKKLKLLQSIAILFSFLALSILIFVLLGYSSSDNKSLKEEGFGLFNANLAGFFNNINKSFFPIGFENYAREQYEGFSYLGLGTILALASAIICALIRRAFPFSRIHIWITVCAGLLAVYSFLGNVSFGKYLLFKGSIPGIEILENLFRTNGRFIWPFMYLAMCLSLYQFRRILPKSGLLTYGIIPLVFLVQMVDVSPNFKKAKKVRPIPTAFRSELWLNLFEQNDMVLPHPFYSATYADWGDASYMLYNAFKAGKPIATGFYGRGNYLDKRAFLEETKRYLESDKQDTTWFKRVWITSTEKAASMNLLVREGDWFAFKFFDYLIYLHKSNHKSIELLKDNGAVQYTDFTTIAKFIENHTGHLFALVTNDEASRKLDVATKNLSKQRSIELDQLKYREALISVFDENRSFGSRKGFECLDTTIIVEKWGRQIKLDLNSSSKEVKDCLPSSLTLDGIFYTGLKRGIQILAIDSMGGVSEAKFDTYNSPFQIK